MRSFGIAFIAGCEWVLGFYLGFYTLLSVSAIVSKYRHPEHVLATCLAAVGSGIACALVFKTGSGRYKGKRWAWLSSWVIGACMISFAALCLSDGLTITSRFWSCAKS